MVRLCSALRHGFSIDPGTLFRRYRTTRIALALAFARIFPPREKTRSYAISMAILFFLFFIVIVIQSVWFCNNDFAWITTSLVNCNFHGELLYFLVVGMVLVFLSNFSLIIVLF